jgi:hypothetical protein
MIVARSRAKCGRLGGIDVSLELSMDGDPFSQCHALQDHE